jgi:ElaB/YqjD/DUF883 family membrane-anchored ribosome-binding protein
MVDYTLKFTSQGSDATMASLDGSEARLVLVESQDQYTVVVDPEIQISEALKQEIADLQAQLDTVKDQVNAQVDTIKAELENAVGRLNDALEQLKELAGDDAKAQAEAALATVLAQVRQALVDYVTTSIYANEYDPTVKTTAYGKAFTQASQTETEWLTEKGIAEGPGGVLERIDDAVVQANTAISDIPDGPAKTYVMGQLGIPAGGMTKEWAIANATSVSGTLNSLCSNPMVAYAGLATQCNDIKAAVQDIADDLTAYQNYSDLLANPPADPAAWAAQKANQADADEMNRAQGVADATGLAAGDAFDQAVQNLQPLIEQSVDQAKAKIQELIGQVKAELEAAKQKLQGYAQQVKTRIKAAYAELLTQASGLTLVSTTTLGIYSGSNSRALTWGDLINGDLDIAPYAITVNRADYAPCQFGITQLESVLTLESTWPAQATVDFDRTVTLPTFHLEPIAVSLQDVTINVPGFGDQTLPAAQLNDAINQFLNERVNSRLAAIESEWSGREVPVSFHAQLDLPDLAGEWDRYSENYLAISYSPLTCNDFVLPPDPDGPGAPLTPPIQSDDGLSSPSTGYYAGATQDSAVLPTLAVALGIAGAAGAGYLIRRRLVRR